MALSRKARRTLWIIAAVAVATSIVIILVVLLKLDAIVREGVEVGGSSVLGVRTQLKGASVSLLGEKVTLKGLDVANPEGFENASFVKADLVSVSAQVSGLMKKEVHLYEVILESPKFSYEVPFIGGKSNVDVLMDNMKSWSPPKPANEPKGEPMKFRIDLLRVTNATVHVVYLGQPVTITLPEIELKNMGDGHGNGIPPDRIVAALLVNITGSIGAQLAGLGKGGFELLGKNAPKAGALGEQGEKGIVKEGEKAVGAVEGLFGK